MNDKMTATRRDAIKYGLCASLAMVGLAEFDSISSVGAQEKKGGLKIETISVKVGATKPFSAIHIADTHLSYGDENENEEIQKLVKERLEQHSQAEANFREAVELARQKNALFVHTGDLLDFYSANNCAAVKRLCGEPNFPESIFCCGNHEFRKYYRPKVADEAYKSQTIDALQEVFPNDLRFASKVVNGVNFVAFDDAYYYVLEDLRERFQQEVDKGLPIVAVCHIPFYAPDLYQYVTVDRKGEAGSEVAVPEEKMKNYSEFRLQQQRADQKTIDFVDWLRRQTLLKAILCGHVHFNYLSQFSETATQYVVGANFRGSAYELLFE